MSLFSVVTASKYIIFVCACEREYLQYVQFYGVNVFIQKLCKNSIYVVDASPFSLVFVFRPNVRNIYEVCHHSYIGSNCLICEQDREYQVGLNAQNRINNSGTYEIKVLTFSLVNFIHMSTNKIHSVKINSYAVVQCIFMMKSIVVQ